MRCFTITLPETPGRTAKAKKHFRARGVDSQFFNGINAVGFGLKTAFPYEMDDPEGGFNMGFKPTGIWLSHYMLWAALSILPDTPENSHFMICEIDAQFVEDWNTRLEEAITDTPPDYDILYVGSCCCTRQPKKRIKNDIWEVRWPVCLQCYIVAKKALPVLIATQRKVYAPIDISLTLHSYGREPGFHGVNERPLKVYTVIPRIVDQSETPLPV